MFINSILGNYYIDTFFGDFPAETSPVPKNTILEILFCTHEPTPRDEECETNLPEFNPGEDFWTLNFDGSKTKDGAGAGCASVDPEKNKTLIACRLEFECTNNAAEYEALIQGFRKATGLGVKNMKVFGDSEIIFKQVRNSVHCVSKRLARY